MCNTFINEILQQIWGMGVTYYLRQCQLYVTKKNSPNRGVFIIDGLVSSFYKSVMGLYFGTKAFITTQAIR